MRPLGSEACRPIRPIGRVGLRCAQRQPTHGFLQARCWLDRTPNCIYICNVITFDESKRIFNLQKRGFDFIGAEAVFRGFTIPREDGRDAYVELRLQTLGLWHNVVVFVVHTPRGADDHIISIREAAKHEERIYWNNFPT